MGYVGFEWAHKGSRTLDVARFADRPPRCRECGALATHVEEYELSQSPRGVRRSLPMPPLRGARRTPAGRRPRAVRDAPRLPPRRCRGAVSEREETELRLSTS